jgi:L-iditol 2-dehydrogenase
MKTIASGICGSDVMEWYRIKKAPLVLGHEVAGEVVEVGEGISDFKAGDRIFATHHVACGECKYCKAGQETVCETLRTTKFHPGGFSEYIRIPEINVQKGVLKLPDEVSFEEGSFLEPLGCVVRGQRIADIKEGQSVLVLGSGISGLLHIQLAKANGAKVTATDISEYRLEAAKKFGADEAINAKDYQPKPFDSVIVCTGALPAIKQAMQSVDKGGTVLFFAPSGPDVEVPMPLNELWSKCATLTTSYAAVEEDLREALELIKSKKINVKGMITHRLPLAETGKGFKLVSEAQDSIKVIIEPQK